MTRNAKLLAALGLVTLGLAACDGSEGPAAPGTVQSQFGSLFAAAFDADANAVPKDGAELAIVYGGVDGVDLTAAPVDF